MSGLALQDVSKRFGDFTAVDNVSLSIPHGTFVCMLGPSGCGKTSLLHMIARLEDGQSMIAPALSPPSPEITRSMLL